MAQPIAIQSFTPGDFIIRPGVQLPVTLKADQVLARGTLLGQITGTGEFVPWDAAGTDGREWPRGVLLAARDTTGAAGLAPVMFGGLYASRHLVWTEGSTVAELLARLAASGWALAVLDQGAPLADLLEPGESYPTSYTPPDFTYQYTRKNWSQKWQRVIDSPTGDNGQQFRSVRKAPGGLVVANGATIAYQGNATETANASAGGTAGTGDAVNMLAVAYDAATGDDIWATMAVSDSYSRAYAVTVDEANNRVYLAGRAGDLMPTTAGAFQTAFQGDDNVNNLYGAQDAYVMCLDGTTGAVLHQSYFGVPQSGDFFRDAVFNAWDGYLYAGYARFGTGTPGMPIKLLRIAPDLSAVLAEWDYGNATSSPGGHSALAIRGDTLFHWLHTDTAVNAASAPGPGAFQETPNPGTSHGYIARHRLTEAGFTLEAATYVRCATADVDLVNGTHGIAIHPSHGGSLIIQAGTGAGGDPPIVGTPQIFSTVGTGASWVAQMNWDLTALHYSTFIRGTTDNARHAGDSVRVSDDGRLLLGYETDSPTLPVTDGSTHPEGLGSSRGGFVILRPTEDETGWEVEEIGYANFLGSYRGAEWDANGGAYLTGVTDDAGSGTFGPIIGKYEGTLQTWGRTLGENVYFSYQPISSGPLTNAMTLEFVGKVTFATGSVVFPLVEQGGGLIKASVYDDGHVGVRTSGLPETDSAAGVVTPGVEHHIRALVDGPNGIVRVYVDDVLAVTANEGSPIAFGAALNLFMLGGSAGLSDVKYGRVWAAVATDPVSGEYVTPDAVPDATFIGDAAAVNAHPLKGAAASFIDPPPPPTPVYQAYALTNTLTDVITPDLPTHSAGMALVMSIHCDRGQVTAPKIPGWVPLTTGINGTDDFQTETYTFWKIAGAAEVAPTITFNAAPVNSYAVVISAFSGVHKIHAKRAFNSNQSTGTTFDMPGITTRVDNALILLIASNRRRRDNMTSSATKFAPLNVTSELEANGEASPYLAYFEQASAGTAADTTVTVTGFSVLRPTGAVLALVGAQ